MNIEDIYYISAAIISSVGGSALNAVFALDVWSGLLGATLMLLRKAWAVQVFLFSLIMVIVSFVLDAISGNLSALGLSYLGIMTFTLILSLFEAWYSKRMKVHGILQ